MKKRLTALMIGFTLFSGVALANDGDGGGYWVEEYANNEEYCEEIYYEDYDNCGDWEDSRIELTPDFCESVVFESTKERCFKELEDEKEK
jgi:hypothetical protein